MKNFLDMVSGWFSHSQAIGDRRQGVPTRAVEQERQLRALVEDGRIVLLP